MSPALLIQAQNAESVLTTAETVGIAKIVRIVTTVATASNVHL